MALTRLAAHFWSERGPSEWKIVFEDYADDLKIFPADIIGASIATYRRQAKWWPKVSELLEIAKPMLAKRQTQLARIQKIMGQKPVDRQTDREEWKRRLGEAHDDFMLIPWDRRYNGTPEDFLAGWTVAPDKRAFCDSWGIKAA